MGMELKFLDDHYKWKGTRPGRHITLEERINYGFQRTGDRITNEDRGGLQKDAAGHTWTNGAGGPKTDLGTVTNKDVYKIDTSTAAGVEADREMVAIGNELNKKATTVPAERQRIIYELRDNNEVIGSKEDELRQLEVEKADASEALDAFNQPQVRFKKNILRARTHNGNTNA